MAAGRAYLDSTESPLYVARFERYNGQFLTHTWIMGPYGTKGAAKSQLTTEMNKQKRWPTEGRQVTGVVLKCESPQWEEVLD